MKKLKKLLNMINVVASREMGRVEKGAVAIDEFEEIVVWLEEAVAELKVEIKEYKDYEDCYKHVDEHEAAAMRDIIPMETKR